MNSRAKNILCLLILATFLATGCTVIRNGEGGEGGAEGGGGGGGLIGGVDGNGGSQDELEPVNVDLLVMLPIDQSPVADIYPRLIEQVVTAMELAFLNPRRIAIAPMYHRMGNEAPLLWGLDDPEAEFAGYSEAIEYFASDEGINLLEDNPDHLDGQNLLDLGPRLGMSAIFHPTSTAAEGRYYFDERPEGLVVLWINPFKRRCGISECQDEGGLIATQLTARDENGDAAWLTVAGAEGLPAERVFHLFIGTEETSDEEDFFSRCGDQAGFPSSILDSISPSPKGLYGKLQDRMDDAGIPNDEIDFCDALSTIQSPLSHTLVATSIRGAMTR